ncbi:mitotic-spindle organizing protein 1-like [Haematobia irritans]|uniref:Putative mitotic-spindle organizing gamma-tubulin ring associated n=1 Tax=Haematobia irritans TaxID=7368 RepID=A0A1L8EC76_HAEIR
MSNKPGSGDCLDGGSNKVNGSNYLKLQQSQVIRNNIHAISQLLNTGLNAESLDTCIKLIEAGVHPQALAEVITQIRREVSALRSNEEQ